MSHEAELLNNVDLTGFNLSISVEKTYVYTSHDGIDMDCLLSYKLFVN